MPRAMPALRRKCAQPRPAHNALRTARVVHLSSRLWRWVGTQTPPRCALVTPIPATFRTQATQSGILGHSPFFIQATPTLATFCPSDPACIPASFCFHRIAQEPVPAQELSGKEKETDQGKPSPASGGGGVGVGSPNPLSTHCVQGLQPLSLDTHRANCVQSMAPDPVEPSRTQRHGLSHPSMAQVGSPSSCQTKARDPGIPVGLQRPPVSPLPPSRRPRVSSQGGHAQGGSALLQPASSRAPLCTAQQPHGLWAKIKGSSAGLKPVKQGTKTCPQSRGPVALAAAGRLAGGTTNLTRTSRKQRSTPSLSFCPREL